MVMICWADCKGKSGDTGALDWELCGSVVRWLGLWPSGYGTGSWVWTPQHWRCLRRGEHVCLHSGRRHDIFPMRDTLFYGSQIRQNIDPVSMMKPVDSNREKLSKTEHPLISETPTHNHRATPTSKALKPSTPTLAPTSTLHSHQPFSAPSATSSCKTSTP